MGIRFHCTHCDKTLNVKEEFSGRSGVCPYCRGEVLVPAGSSDAPDRLDNVVNTTSEADSGVSSGSIELSSAERPESELKPSIPSTDDTSPSASESESALSERPGALWFVRPPEGGQYGPASNELMRRWIAEDRVGVQSWVWRSDWTDWLPADRVFDTLGDSPQDDSVVKLGRASSKSAEYMRDKRRRMRISVMTIVLLVLVLITLLVILMMLTNPVPHSS